MMCNLTNTRYVSIAMVFTLKTWKHYKYGTLFQVFNDNKSLKYSFDQKDITMR